MEYKIYTPSTILEFGRYKGKTFEEVMEEDTEYMEWFIREIDNVLLAVEERCFNRIIFKTSYQDYHFDDELKEILISRQIGHKLHYTPYYIWRNDIKVRYYYDGDEFYYDDEPYYTNDEDMWADIAGSDDPEDIETAYWNLD